MTNKKNTCYGYYKKVTISLDVEDTELADELAAQLGVPVREVISTALKNLKEQTDAKTEA